MLVLPLVLVVAFARFSRAEEERANQIQISDNEVYRSAYYVQRVSAVKLSCVPPKESNGKYDDLAIYKGNASSADRNPRELICKATAAERRHCQLATGEKPSLSVNLSEGGLYICAYSKQPEPAVKEAEVNLYFKRVEMKRYDGDAPVNDVAPLQVTNETSYRLVCPGGDQTGTRVEWYRNEHHLKLEHNPSYVLNDTNGNLTFLSKGAKITDGSRYGGWYRCERFSKDNQLLATAFTKVNSHAYAAAAQKSYNKMEGESATLSCDIDGEPVPKVTWKRGDKVLVSDSDENKRITFSAFKGIPHASMTISNLVAEDYGEYTCLAKSDDGSESGATALLRVRSKLAALWPFLGIVAEVIVLVAIIFIYEKRRAKKEQEENEDTADQKKSLTASNNENKDVRQRKA